MAAGDGIHGVLHALIEASRLLCRRGSWTGHDRTGGREVESVEEGRKGGAGGREWGRWWRRGKETGGEEGDRCMERVLQ